MIPREELLLARRLASRANPRIKEWAGLADRTSRLEFGLTLAEGAKLVAEGLSADAGVGYRPAALIVSDSGALRPEAGGLFVRAGAMGLERYSVTDDCYAKISSLKGSDGIALVLSIAGTGTDWTTRFASSGARWLVAAEVQDPGNAGALARTALAAGFDGCLYLDGADPHSPKFLRGGMGASFRLPCLALTLGEFVAGWKRCGATLVVATAAAAAPDFRALDYRPPLAVAVGGERGMPEALSALADQTARIPLRGGVESLNLAVAAGIILFEAERKRDDTTQQGASS